MTNEQYTVAPVIAGEYRFAAVGYNIWQGSRRVAVAASKNMAIRIANALNNHKPNRAGR
jgi:hypothetical protein